MNNIKIIGGGLAGLIAAHQFRTAHVFEAGPRLQMHKALLRFRSDDVSNITGVPFRKVRVYKEVHHKDKIYQGKCPVSLANMYAAKVTGAISGRSIMKLEECDRYIAPDNFYDVLCDRLEGEGRLHFNQAIKDYHIDRATADKSISWINTAPLPVILKILGIEGGEFMNGFKRSPIKVARYKINTPCDVYQTIYFPDKQTSLFRASITGDIMIVESISGIVNQTHNNAATAAHAFGLTSNDFDIDAGEVVDQAYGKIMDLEASARESILYQLTNKYNIFSLGRFATWRNILLDDVADDLPKIERLINASQYGREKLLKL